MKTYYKDYGITASITDRRDGTAKLTARAQSGVTVHDKVQPAGRRPRLRGEE